VTRLALHSLGKRHFSNPHFDTPVTPATAN